MRPYIIETTSIETCSALAHKHSVFVFDYSFSIENSKPDINRRQLMDVRLFNSAPKFVGAKVNEFVLQMESKLTKPIIRRDFQHNSDQIMIDLMIYWRNVQVLTLFVLFIAQNER